MNKKAFEMTITTVIVLVLALILLSVGIFITYKYILKPSEAAGSILSCDARGGTPGTGPGCPGQDCTICIKLLIESTKKTDYCCIQELK